MPTFDPGDWIADHPAVHREDLGSDDDTPEPALLRHPSWPFRARIPAAPEAWFDELRLVADAYLARVAPLHPALQRVAGLLTAGDPTGFGWLPLGWGGPLGDVDPTGSFVVRRHAGNGAVDATVVLLAANREAPADGGPPRPEGLGVGLRVMMHLDALATPDELAVRVTGLCASRLAQARAPAGEARAFVDDVLRSADARLALQLRIAQLCGLHAPSVGFNGFESTGENRYRIAGVGARAAESGPPRAYEWLVELEVGRDGNASTPPRAGLSWRLVEQFSEGAADGTAAPTAAQARLYLRDAASMGDGDTTIRRRVTRNRQVLDALRRRVPLPATLRDPAHTPPHFEVLQSTVADPDNDPDAVQQVDPTQLPLRSDHLAAAHAYRRAQELFAVLARCGLQPASCFKFAQMPLRLRHRASFNRHPDGKSVNAQVRPDAATVAYLSPPALASRPRLEVRFGAAALRHRDTEADEHGRLTAQPLGLAADPRWAWHEFGHVLGFAATGALEFQFAHSVGDALAAVLHDPGSHLQRWRPAGERGDTYPWVPTGRRHDRDARRGWCWCGRRNGMRHAPLVLPPRLYKGYVEEQMLSSSIFRLYRAVGGDTRGDRRMRRRAAMACVDRMLRALLLCGPAGLLPVRSADTFVSALIDADVGCHARAGTDDVEGGCLHKAMRWAFEQQGLYATANAMQDVEGLGLPPAVDLFIEDSRPAADGGYHPVPLRWGADAPWHASGRVLTRDAQHLHVTVGNRGRQEARQITLRAWVAPDLAQPLQWQPTGGGSIDRLPRGAEATVALDLPAGLTPQAPCLALVEASCAADRANLDLATALPIAAASPPTTHRALIDLVANDNNLGLRHLPAFT